MVPRPSSALDNAVAPGVRVSRIEPIGSRIARNRWRFGGFMLSFAAIISAGAALVAAAAFPLLVYIVSQVMPSVLEMADMADVARAFWLLVGGSAGATFVVVSSLAFSRLIGVETKLLARLDARMPKGGTLLATKSVLRDMAIAAGLPKTPQFYVIDSNAVNAFVLGRSHASARIGVTRGLLERTSPDEQRAVFANLIARIASLDILWATAISAVMGPVWRFREQDFTRDDRDLAETLSESGTTPGGRSAGSAILLFLPVWGVAIVVTELLAWYHQESLWSAAEKADAEGMMLLKDPRSMLSALESVLERDNHVHTAGEAYSQLFYCWAGFGFAPEDDPEMRRVARLREVLGAEGAAYVPRPNVPDWPTAPAAPYLELREEMSRNGTEQGARLR